MTLKNQAFSAVRWTSIAAIVRGILQIIQLTIFTRLLTPEDFGVMSIVLVILSFIALFSDLGLTSAYIQNQKVTQSQRSNLFWLNIGTSLLLMLILIVLSPTIADFFDNERLAPLLMLSSITFLFTALGQQIKANAEKTLNFKPLAIIEISAAVAGFLTAIFFALAGLGVFSLVYGSICGTLTFSLLAWKFISKGWHPQLRFSFSEMKCYLVFGGSIMVNGIVNQLNMSIDLLIGGRLLSATQLGLFSVPRNLILQIQFMINPIITRVGFPLISQIQYDIPKVRSVYLQTLNMTASANAPIYLGFAFFAPEIVYIMFGNKWSDSIDILRVLSVWGLFRSFSNPAGSLLMGMGHANLALKWNICLLFLIFPALWFGSLWGVTGMTWSMLGLAIILFIPGWYILINPLCEVTLAEYLRSIFKPITITLLSITPAYLITLSIYNPFLTLIVSLTIFTASYFYLSSKFNPLFIKSVRTFFGINTN